MCVYVDDMTDIKCNLQYILEISHEHIGYGEKSIDKNSKSKHFMWLNECQIMKEWKGSEKLNS